MSMSSTDKWISVMGHQPGPGNFSDFPEYSPDGLDTDEHMISPRSIDSDIHTEVQVDSMDSISQRNVNIQDVEKEHPRYIQNHVSHTNNYAQHIHSPRSQRYRSIGKSQAKLAKIITVPEPNPPLENHAAAGHHRHKVHMNQLMHGTVPSNHGVMRGISSQYVGGSMRGFSTGPTSTFGHASLRRLPNEIPRGSVAFRRHRHEKKEYNITQFDVVLDRHEKHRYLPGEEIMGKVIFDIARDTDVRFIELLIVGQTSASFVHNHDVANARTKRDVFLSKRSYIIGSPDGRWNSLIKAGHYVSNFRFQLPESVPSSMKYEDKINGFGMDIGYLVKSRICDEVGTSSARSTHSVNNYVKVLMSRRQIFSVKRPFDIHSIPMALTPVSHNEDMPVSCSIFSTSNPATIFLSMDRTCFLAGDDIRIHLETLNKHARQIKKISCLLEQKVLVKGVRSQATFHIANIEQRYPKGNLLERNKQNVTFYDILLPTHTTFLPSILSGCRLVRVNYNLTVVIKLTNCKGKLLMDIPINIGPCTDPVSVDNRNSSVPMFNKPLRFPYFSPHSSSATSNGDVWNVQDKYRHGVKVTSKHSYGACSSKFCCCLASETLI